MLPREIINVIQSNLRRLYNDTPADDIITDLLVGSVISEYEASKIKRMDEDRDKNFELIRILKKRGESDFFKFCDALKKHVTQHVQELGILLENQAKEAWNGNSTTNNSNAQSGKVFN